MELCKGCARPLITTGSGACRFCGRPKGKWQAGKPTFTAAGAQRELAKQKVKERKLSPRAKARIAAKRDAIAAEGKRERAAQRELAQRVEQERRDESARQKYASQAEAAQRVRTAQSLTWTQAEILVCEWMRNNGYPDAHVTPPGADNGVDVRSAKAIAQVKHHAKAIGRQAIQQLAGVCVAEQRRGLFFSLAGYTAPALLWAEQNGIKLYTYLPIRRVT